MYQARASHPTLMAKCFAHLFLALVVLLCMSLPPVSGADAKDGEAWCVAKSDAGEVALQAALDWACGHGETDCGPIQQGGTCFQPDDVQSHASYSFSDYFRRHGPSASACDFNGTATITSINPSAGTCMYPSSNMSVAGAPEPAPQEGTSGGPRLQPKTLPMSLAMALLALCLASNLVVSFSW